MLFVFALYTRPPGKSYTAIGFISLFSYAGVSVAGKVCGNLAQSSGGWRLPVLVMVVTATVGAALFACLWCVRADAYAD